MKINYKITTFVLLAIALSLLVTVVVLAGNLDSPSEPSSSFSFTLEDIYNRLNEGTAGAQSAFTEPSSAPGSTMHTLNDIMEKAPAVDETNGATADEVLTGKTVWGLTSGAWGVITGTLPLAPLPKTGQTKCYDIVGDEIACTDTGQDGDLQKGVTWPTSRFTDNANGTLTDNLTGLVWLKNANCSGGEDSWVEGLPYSNELYDGCTNCFGGTADCGLSDGSEAGDWRLPNVNELFSLINFGESDNATWLTDKGFENVKSEDPDYYCSSTTIMGSLTNAFSVNLVNGLLIPNGKNERCYVLPVRDAQ
jgi:hypothetical protein